MRFDQDIRHRRSIRLRDYDYSTAGAYFVTICTFERECLLGDVVNGEMRLSDMGQLVAPIWDSLGQRYPDAEVDAFVIMPNHIHGIITINGDVQVGAIHESPLQNRRAMTLSRVIGYLKMNAAKRINQLRDNPGAPVWQRNYYERVIRNGRELQSIQQYIVDNPAKWQEDENHPAHL
ncbi:MAG: transposase [Desulfuromusa sp.]|nr:transposase [Desulfuromusa sp.]